MEALLYFLIWAVAIVLMMRLGCGKHVMGGGNANPDSSDGGGQATPEGLRWIPPLKDVDPVCGKTVRTDRAKPSVHDGSVYYFCSRDCREIFEAAPEQYTGHVAKDSRPHLENSHV
ncbi:YHS domain-containing protein [Aurantimonas sp. C2-6-R+9]|uniref:YHS domain-containing protein n=1 Tax=unclassified Aurantimonas TaxID=2638230 RepID=UPI002E187D8F|nr:MULTISPECIES: YHS domain-containing protein [unclassified Aurantimonas]MEC5292872.1 YHS domain-containing protein [Aurantimonas sp. C2-3-R2]MEC5382024.1 YHS domain-containing protein [Aurantimonas sp. C2-6-R+9]MEC5413920.1 YHS domain-containing protein [Aurantimonas sp. C2-4-R8]